MGRPSSFFSMVLSRAEEGGEGARGPPLMGGRGGDGSSALRWGSRESVPACCRGFHKAGDRSI